MFRVGQKVVCVDASPITPGSIFTGAQEGGIYTVRWVGPYEDEPCIRLQETQRDCWVRGVRDLPYRSCRFRPLVERKTDISIFKALLNPTKQTERV